MFFSPLYLFCAGDSGSWRSHKVNAGARVVFSCPGLTLVVGFVFLRGSKSVALFSGVG